LKRKSLDAWLSWQQQLHASSIELGLERISKVAEKLKLTTPPFLVITVAGTNGKGSSVAMFESILSHAGFRVGAYTSPHFLRYNERVRINQLQVSNDLLCEAFEKVESSRNNTSLSFFEYGTLAALSIFIKEQVEIAILEVGLGGRLDAVNILDNDLSVLTSISLDHTDWLGEDREAIAFEKSGIMRSGKPAICIDRNPPKIIANVAKEKNVSLYQIGEDFDFRQKSKSWVFIDNDDCEHELPYPNILGRVQLHNACGVLMGIKLLELPRELKRNAYAEGLKNISILGRFQTIKGDVETLLDIAHNQESAMVLSENLSDLRKNKTLHAVFAVLADKDVASILNELGGLFSSWHISKPANARGLSAEALADNMKKRHINNVHSYATVTSAYYGALNTAQHGDSVVVFGSAFTVAEVLSLHV